MVCSNKWEMRQPNTRTRTWYVVKKNEKWDNKEEKKNLKNSRSYVYISSEQLLNPVIGLNLPTINFRLGYYWNNYDFVVY